MPEPVHLRKGEPIAVGVATSLTVGLTNNRQITFQTGHEGNESPDVVFNRYMGVMKIADRIQAIYEIPEIEDELFKHRETLANFVEDKDRIEANHVKAQAERQVQVEEVGRLKVEALAKAEVEIDGTILKIQETRKAEFDAGMDEHNRSGKMGSYVPRGSRARNLALADESLEKAKKHRAAALEEVSGEHDRMVARLETEIVRADAEKDQALANIGISIKRFEEAIVERQERLAKKKAVAEG